MQDGELAGLEEISVGKGAGDQVLLFFRQTSREDLLPSQLCWASGQMSTKAFSVHSLFVLIEVIFYLRLCSLADQELAELKMSMAGSILKEPYSQ